MYARSTFSRPAPDPTGQCCSCSVASLTWLTSEQQGHDSRTIVPIADLHCRYQPTPSKKHIVAIIIIKQGSPGEQASSPAADLPDKKSQESKITIGIIVLTCCATALPAPAAPLEPVKSRIPRGSVRVASRSIERPCCPRGPIQLFQYGCARNIGTAICLSFSLNRGLQLTLPQLARRPRPACLLGNQGKWSLRLAEAAGWGNILSCAPRPTRSPSLYLSAGLCGWSGRALTIGTR